MNITNVSVTVMRSHDYCHFSVTLGATVEASDNNAQAIAATDELRKTAARLADKAVDQYKVYKANEVRLQREARERRWEEREIKNIEEIAEGERTPEQQAKLKAFKDANWEASKQFDYEDNWEHDGTDD